MCICLRFLICGSCILERNWLRFKSEPNRSQVIFKPCRRRQGLIITPAYQRWSVLIFPYINSTVVHMFSFPALVLWALPGLAGGYPHRLHHLQCRANTHWTHCLLSLLHLWGRLLWGPGSHQERLPQRGGGCEDHCRGRGAAGPGRAGGGVGGRAETEREVQSIRTITGSRKRERQTGRFCCPTQH